MSLFILFCILAGGAEPDAGLPREELPWVRVETAHFTIFSYAPEAKTLQIVNEVERFRALLEFMMPRETPKRAAKIPIFVFSSNSGFAPYNRPGLTGDVERFGGFFRETRFGPIWSMCSEPPRGRKWSSRERTRVCWKSCSSLKSPRSTKA